MIKKGRIKFIEQVQDYENNHGTFHTWKVTTHDDRQLIFYSRKGNAFKHNVNDTMYYKYKKDSTTHATLMEAPEETYQEKPAYIKQIPSKPYNKPPDTQTSIVRQSSLKAAIEFHANDKVSRVEEVLNTARIFVEFVNNG